MHLFFLAAYCNIDSVHPALVKILVTYAVIQAHKQLSLPRLKLLFLILSRVSEGHDVVEDAHWYADESQVGQ